MELSFYYFCTVSGLGGPSSISIWSYDLVLYLPFVSYQSVSVQWYVFSHILCLPMTSKDKNRSVYTLVLILTKWNVSFSESDESEINMRIRYKYIDRLRKFLRWSFKFTMSLYMKNNGDINIVKSDVLLTTSKQCV